MSNIFSISSDLTFIFTIISCAAERRLDEGPLVESSSPYHVSGRASEAFHDSIYGEPLYSLKYLKPLMRAQLGYQNLINISVAYGIVTISFTILLTVIFNHSFLNLHSSQFNIQKIPLIYKSTYPNHVSDDPPMWSRLRSRRPPRLHPLALHPLHHLRPNRLRNCIPPRLQVGHLRRHRNYHSRPLRPLLALPPRLLHEALRPLPRRPYQSNVTPKLRPPLPPPGHPSCPRARHPDRRPDGKRRHRHRAPQLGPVRAIPRPGR